MVQKYLGCIIQKHGDFRPVLFDKVFRRKAKFTVRFQKYHVPVPFDSLYLSYGVTKYLGWYILGLVTIGRSWIEKCTNQDKLRSQNRGWSESIGTVRMYF